MAIKALGVYIYGGGFHFGAKKAGVDILAHLEDGPIVNTKVFSHNRPEVKIEFKPWDLKKYNGVDVVFCNPPCAVWSPIGISLRKGREAYKTDPRIQCWENCVETGLAVKAKYVLIETVPRGITIGKDFILKKARQMQKDGYWVTLFLHSTLWMGAPQDRRRLFFVASRDRRWTPMDEEWTTDGTVDKALATVTETMEPLYKMPPMWKPLWKKQVPRVKGQDMRSLAHQTGIKPVPMFMHHRLLGDKPMGAFCGNYYFHPHEPRFLSMPEMRALCGYPADYSFPDSRSLAACASVFAQAVMPWAGEWIMRSIQQKKMTKIEDDKQTDVLLYDWRVQKKAPIIFKETVCE